jgi:HPt (histidine-containing phosphotransfer) domain-containing protein
MMDSDKRIDLGVIEQLVAELGRESVVDLLSTLIAESRSGMDALLQPALAGDVDAVARYCHTLKGHGRLFGAYALSEAARALEAACANMDVGQRMSALKDLQAQQEHTFSRLRAALGQLAS